MRTTLNDQLLSSSFMSICCDVGWESVYAFIYPISSSHWAGGICACGNSWVHGRSSSIGPWNWPRSGLPLERRVVPDYGKSWISLSVGLSRQYSRGVTEYLQWPHGGDPWLDSPLCWFYIGITLTLDAIYPTVFFHFRRTESGRDGKEAKGD
ncbi:predicted protein [Aspergillus nidulans FGSC A4]|uniref:Uncharacterized protein n=1 Tax=Emericella nidulans (strain FGSC A4 / ATCC 38163 / CBS 112.46 / NRRL 194 / M139) TaxID=227321 RepID=Q5ATK0_EMENI|nr:hypothetical protein [Aspergillus nidulans FGSC A4]EAA66900.1 predicted protein [Aspergillus nidulans FGSC A4]CBF80422.1 TPA: hypothetical protein ANIA_08380 [Aspergillus nidulans FGSC A4]|eukprot:XP_681649.1 predicted protein [Aspergillus nidulans FGSC A4]